MQYNGSNLLLDSFVSIIKRDIINKRNKQKLQHVPYNFTNQLKNEIIMNVMT